MEPRPLKMATLNHARSFQGCPEEEGIHILVLDTNSQHPHKGTHTFTMSLRRMTIVLSDTYACPVARTHPECTEGSGLGMQPLIQG